MQRELQNIAGFSGCWHATSGDGQRPAFGGPLRAERFRALPNLAISEALNGRDALRCRLHLANDDNEEAERRPPALLQHNKDSS